MSDRCQMCGMRMHRYGFGHETHDPSLVACVNNVLGLIEDVYDEKPPRSVVNALTCIGVNGQRELRPG